MSVVGEITQASAYRLGAFALIAPGACSSRCSRFSCRWRASSA